MTEKFRPSNGTDGECFMARFCYQCARNPDEPEPPCEILGRVMAYDIDAPEYPKEWVRDSYGKNERCTAFVPIGEDIPEPRCTKTADLFDPAK